MSPPSADITNDDGRVLLWAPAEPGQQWRAGVIRADDPEAIVGVVWTPGQYECARHGTSTDRLHCEHTHAATMIATFWMTTKETHHDDRPVDVGDPDAELRSLTGDDRDDGPGGARGGDDAA